MGFALHAPEITLAFDAVLCDMDGLLIDSEGLSIAAWRAALAPYGVDLTDDDIVAMFGLRIDEDAAWIIAHYHPAATVQDLAREKSAQMLAVIRQALQPMPGARDLVAWLVAHDVPRALATSGLEDYARACLDAVGLAQRFDVWVTGDQAPHGKPAPDIFLLAALRLGIAPERCLVLEDAPHGVAAALAAAMPVIAVPNEHTAGLAFPTPTLWASDLGQVLQWLDGV
jgi:HAD superfamily hydrolase (TIGR01509 family)